MRKFLVCVASVLAMMIFGCGNDDLPLGPESPTYGLSSSIRPEAVSLKTSFDVVPVLFVSVDTSAQFGQTSLAVVVGENDLHSSVVRKVEVSYDGSKVYEDTCDASWFGLDVMHGLIDGRDAVVILGGREAPIGSFNRAKLIIDGQVMDIFPRELSYPIYNFEDIEWSGNIPAYWGFDMRIVEGKIVYGISMGLYHSGRSAAVYWFSIDPSSRGITQYGCSGLAS